MIKSPVSNRIHLLLDELDQKMDALPQAKLLFIEDRLREILMMLGDPVAVEAMQAQFGDVPDQFDEPTPPADEGPE